MKGDDDVLRCFRRVTALSGNQQKASEQDQYAPFSTVSAQNGRPQPRHSRKLASESITAFHLFAVFGGGLTQFRATSYSPTPSQAHGRGVCKPGLVSNLNDNLASRSACLRQRQSLPDRAERQNCSNVGGAPATLDQSGYFSEVGCARNGE